MIIVTGATGTIGKDVVKELRGMDSTTSRSSTAISSGQIDSSAMEWTAARDTKHKEGPMGTVTHVYEDRWGAMIDHGDAGYVEIRWYDSTDAMSLDEFQQWLAAFAKQVERLRRPGILVDATRFLVDPAKMSGEWRDANIIPHYNAAGVKKFAFLMSEGMPAIGSPPAVEGPAKFPTAYFARRQEALDWLAAGTSQQRA